MNRVEVRLQVTIENYDVVGNLTDQRQAQPITVAGLSAGAIRAGLDQAATAIVAAGWPVDDLVSEAEE